MSSYDYENPPEGQPVWITEAGSLGKIQEGIFYQLALQAFLPSDPDNKDVLYYEMIAGELPEGIQCRLNGLVEGTPKAVSSLQGVAADVDEDTTSEFCVRVYTERLLPDGTEVPYRVADRTFSLTVTGQDQPEWITPPGQIAQTLDGELFEFQLEYEDRDPGDTPVVSFEGGDLPPQLTVSETGLISGFLEPVTSLNEGAVAGYDGNDGKDAYPYDFTTRSISKNYEFTLGISDGKDTVLRDFSIFVYSTDSLAGDNVEITGDNSFIRGDTSTVRTPLLLNTERDLGTYRHDNFFAFKFNGIDLDGDAIEYVLSLGSGVGYDATPFTGFRVDLECTGTAGTDTLEITSLVDSSLPDSVGELRIGMSARALGVPLDARIISVTGDAVTLDKNLNLDVNGSVVFLYSPGAGVDIDGGFDRDGSVFDRAGLSLPPGLSINSDTGWLTGYLPEQSITEISYRFAVQVRKRDNPVITSEFYFFTMTIIGDIETEVTWLSPEFLGNIVAGTQSQFEIEAETRSGVELSYRLKSGEYPLGGGQYNRLPQGLRLLTSGEIVGTTTFNTFSLDRGTTTFDRELETRREIDETTFDLNFEFTVNAFNNSSITEFRSLTAINVSNGGENYLTPPTVSFTPEPQGSNAIPATAGLVTLSDGVVVDITVDSPGSGYEPGTTGVSVVRTGVESEITVDADAVAVVNESGGVANIIITEPGANYGNVPGVIITGTGTGATATATLGNGAVTAIQLGNPGAGYTQNPNVSIDNFTANTLATGNVGDDFVNLVNPDGTAATISGLAIGLSVTGNGIAAGSNVSNIAGSTVTLTDNLTANVDNQITFTDNSGSGATATANSFVSETTGGISVFKTFNIQVVRDYTEPYESLYIKALPPKTDRQDIINFLSDTTIFQPEFIYRSDDPNYGVASDVVYNHAYGLKAGAISSYVQAMNLNHYERNITLGPLKTAQAVDENDNVIYEVVYSEVVDDLSNQQNQSVSKSVVLQNAVEVNGTTVDTVYPNSLFNMREQIIDEIGRVTPALPQWMISKQVDGRILGFTRAWVIAYTVPGKSGRVKYDIEQAYPEGFNFVDFEIDRYDIDKKLTKNWNPTVDVTGDTVDSTEPTVDSIRITTDLAPRSGNWQLSSGMTTFDRNSGEETVFDSGAMRFVSPVDQYTASDEFDKYVLYPKVTILQ